jgi:hypothetical protein
MPCNETVKLAIITYAAGCFGILMGVAIMWSGL